MRAAIKLSMCGLPCGPPNRSSAVGTLSSAEEMSSTCFMKRLNMFMGDLSSLIGRLRLLFSYRKRHSAGRRSPANFRPSSETRARMSRAFLRDLHCSLAYSDLASFRMGMSGSASFQREVLMKMVLTRGSEAPKPEPCSKRALGYEAN